MPRITTLRPAHPLARLPALPASRATVAARPAPVMARPLRPAGTQRLELQAPRARAGRCAATPEGMGSPMDPLAMTLALGGSQHDVAVLTSSPEALKGAAARMQGHPDAGARRAFVQALLRRDDGAAFAARFAADPDMSVRHALTRSAPAWQAPGARESLRGLAANLEESPWVSQAAVQTLALYSESEALLALREDPRAWVRLAVAEGLAEAAPGAQASMLKDGDAWVRAAVLTSLAAPLTYATLQAVAELAQHDATPWVRHVALRLLAQHDRPAAHRILRQLRGSEQAVLAGTVTRMAPHAPERWAGDVVRRMEEALGLGYSHGLPEVHRDRAEDPHVSPETRRAGHLAALEAGAQMVRDTHSSPEALLHAGALLWQTPHELELLGHLAGLAPRHLAAIVPVLDRLCRSPRVEVRRALPGLLRHLPQEPTTLPMLATLADDTDAEVRREVATELFQLTGRGLDPTLFLPIVRKLLADPEAAVRESAARSLRGVDAPGSVELQALAARDTHAAVRLSTVWNLVHRGTAEAAAVLQLLAQDADPEIRATVARAVGHLRMAHAFPMLALFLNDSTHSVRHNFIWSLYMLARRPEESPRAAELALRALDAAGHADAELTRTLSKTRSEVLTAALVAFRDDRDMLQMLHSWVPAMTEVESRGIEELAASDYPERGALLAQLMDSPHAAVRDTARKAVASVLKQQEAKSKALHTPGNPG